MRLLLATALIISLSGCGTLPSAVCSTDASPTSATLKAQGNFSGGGVSGSVTVYDGGSGTYLIRLTGLTAPNESGLYIKATASGSTVMNYPLKSSCGNQNYTVSASGTFQSVTIRSNTKNQDYSIAPLTAAAL